MSISAREVDLRLGAKGVVLENEHLAVVVWPEKGSDILSIRHKGKDFDPMWVSPWGVRSPHAVQTAPNSHVAWMDAYAGGWQELFPNGGASCIHHGAELPFHGEASMSPWEWEVLPDGVRFFVRLVRSPFTLERTMRLSPREGEIRRTTTTSRAAGIAPSASQVPGTAPSSSIRPTTRIRTRPARLRRAMPTPNSWSSR